MKSSPVLSAALPLKILLMMMGIRFSLPPLIEMPKSVWPASDRLWTMTVRASSEVGGETPDLSLGEAAAEAIETESGPSGCSSSRLIPNRSDHKHILPLLAFSLTEGVLESNEATPECPHIYEDLQGEVEVNEGSLILS